MSAGLHFESARNPHEEFYFDNEIAEFFEYFSTGKYGDDCEVELIINGDFFDFLNVPYRGEFEDAITEQFALYKLECIMAGHKKVIQALKKFASLPGKNIIYNLGNHDADLFFPKVREQLVRAISPNGEFPSPKVQVNFETPVINLSGGVLIHHGNQFEAMHVFNYEKPLLTGLKEPVLNIPWGSFYVLKIVNRFKRERGYIGKVRPVKAMFLWGLLFDTSFTLKFLFLSLFYFLKTRFIYNPKRKSRLGVTFKILKQESTPFLQNLELEARQLLDEQSYVHTVIMGHTHLPMFKSYSDGKTYINTGTWTKMVNLDLQGLGSGYNLTFALVKYAPDGKATATLEKWFGEHRVHKVFG
jgi:UDP-2,3-diacylglucosamine pyrophosphatase LpxH